MNKFWLARRNRKIGRLQRQARRAFLSSNQTELPTAAIVAHCFPRIVRPGRWHRESVCRAARRWCVRVRRERREWWWKLGQISEQLGLNRLSGLAKWLKIRY